MSPADPGPLNYWLDEDGQLQRGLSTRQIDDVYRSERGELWVHIDSTNEPEWRLLVDLFGFHPLAVEDTRSPECRVKLEEYGAYLFVVLRGIHLAEATDAPYDLGTTNLYLFLGHRFLVTVHAGRVREVETVAERMEGGGDGLKRGVEHVAYAIADTMVDDYFPLLDAGDDFVDELEREVFEGNGEAIMQRVFELRRSLLALRRNLAPMREVTSSLATRPTPYLRTETQLYLRDVYDHVVRQLESVEILRERLTGVVETHYAIVSHRANEVMKSLTVVATLVLPATLVASIYGMNFEHMPGLEHGAGFWLALLAMGGISGGFLLYIWWKGWL